MKIARVNDMRQLDRRAIAEYGIIEELLMENAGAAAYYVILENIAISNNNFVIFCGAGNNGGDGLVVARKIHAMGGNVQVFLLADPSKYKGAAKTNYDIAVQLPIKMMELNDPSLAKQAIQTADAIIDAIFGTGLDREVGGNYKEVIDLINSSQKTVVSIYIPSGVNGDTGQVMGTAVKANYTITFGLPKIGNILDPGYQLGGKLFVTHISFPPALHNSDQLKIATNDPIPLTARPRDTHKGDYGKVLFIAGSANYLGAPYFAAMSFLKAGGGLSFLATPEIVAPFIANKGSEIIFQPHKATATGSIALENKQSLLAFSEKVDMVVMGPGLSLNEETQQLVRELTPVIQKPLVIDGDGITAISEHLDCLKDRKAATVLTPHLGEMSRITHRDINEIAANRIDLLQQTSRELASIIILKGAHTLIGYPDESVFVNFSGNPGMATAGSGDVLTGTIAAMFGLGLSVEDASRMGVFIHGFAGDLAAAQKGEDGLVAGDILDQLPAALKKYRENFDEIVQDYYHSIFLI